MTNTNAHILSNLPIRKSTIPIDDNTTALFHYDISANSQDGIIKPLGSYIDESTILYYDMSDTFTNSNGTYVVDKSNYGNYGKVNGATITNGRNGKALYFDGVDDYIQVRLSATDNGTIEMWYKPSSFYNFNTLWDNSLSANDWECWIYNTGVIGVRLSASQSLVSYNLNDLGGANKWYHIVLTWERVGSTKLFIDGEVRATQTTIWSNPGEYFYFGGNNGNTKGTGATDKIVILNKAISADEIRDRYNQGIYTLRNDGKYGGAIAIEESTENLINEPDITKWSQSGGGVTVLNTNLIYNNAMVYKVSFDKDSTGRIHLNGFPQGGPYTGSFYIKKAEDTASDDYSFFFRKDGFGTTYGTSSGKMNDSWQRVELKNITCSDSFMFLIYKPSTTATRSFYITMPQLELKHTSTSYIDGYREHGKLMYNHYLTNASEFTISFWMYLEDKPSSNPDYESIININNGTDVNGLYIDYYNNTTLRLFTYNSVGTAQIASTDTSLLRNQWAHIVVKRDTTKLYGYINGELKCTVNNSGVVNLNGILEFGTRRTAPTQSANLLIDELRIDKVSRSDEEILAWYFSDSPFFPLGNERIIG